MLSQTEIIRQPVTTQLGEFFGADVDGVLKSAITTTIVIMGLALGNWFGLTAWPAFVKQVRDIVGR